MSLIGDYLPIYHFSEKHGCIISAEPKAILDAVESYRPDSDPFFRIMIAIRELPMRLFGGNKTLPPPFGLHNFTRLERGEQALVFGLIGRFWRLDFGLEQIADAHAFKAFDRLGVAKLVLGFETFALEDGRHQLVTQTRVYCPDHTSRLKFTPYWWLVRPVSGLIRRRILTSIKSASERISPAG